MKQPQMKCRHVDRTPRIYVTPSAKNNGSHQHGCWIDGDQAADVITEKIHHMLTKSGHRNTDQWAITDSKHFGELDLKGHSSIDANGETALGITEYGPVFSSLLVYLGGYKYIDDARRYMLRGYRGSFPSAEEFARQLVQNQWRASIENLPEGIYTIKLKGKNINATQKFVKQ